MRGNNPLMPMVVVEGINNNITILDCFACCLDFTVAKMAGTNDLPPKGGVGRIRLLGFRTPWSWSIIVRVGHKIK
jgi:hypothetical protein